MGRGPRCQPLSQAATQHERRPNALRASTEPIDREPRGYPYLAKENEALLRAMLASAGVELGKYEVRAHRRPSIPDPGE